MEQVPLFVAFSAGLLSFLSPCVIPLAPVYLASLAGPEIFERMDGRVRLTLFLHSLSFVAGFSLVFVILGTIIGLAGFAIGPYSAVTRQIVGSILIVFGLFMLVALKVPGLNFEKSLAPSLGATPGYLRSFLTGGVFCLAWTPCVGPVLGGIMALALDSATAWQGAYLLAIYSLGLGLPFLIIGGAFNAISPLLRRIRQYSRWVYIISGLLLIAMGVLVLTDKIIWFSSVV